VHPADPLGSLTPAEVPLIEAEKLSEQAGPPQFGGSHISPDDLLHEAIRCALENDENSRNCPTRVGVVEFLAETMRRISSGEQEKQKSRHAIDALERAIAANAWAARRASWVAMLMPHLSPNEVMRVSAASLTPAGASNLTALGACLVNFLTPAEACLTALAIKDAGDIGIRGELDSMLGMSSSGKRRIARRFELVDSDKSNLARSIGPVAADGDKSGSSNLDAEDAEIAAYVATLHDLHNRLDENQVSQDNPDLAMRHMGVLMDRKAAILLINGSAMEDCAYKSVYGAKVLRDIRTVPMWISAHHAKYRAHPKAEQLYELVGYANDTARPTTRECVKRAVDLGLVSLEKKGRFTYYYLTPDQMKKATAIIDYLAIIPEVVKLQVKNPYDKTAGRHLLPAEVYYNIIGIANFPDVEEVAESCK